MLRMTIGNQQINCQFPLSNSHFAVPKLVISKFWEELDVV